jgi:serine/threonine protein kinase
MQTYDGWEPLRDDYDLKREKLLGKGGQGEVYLVRSPQQAASRQNLDKRIIHLLVGVGHNTSTATELSKCLLELGGPDPAESLGALKKFVIPSDNKDEEARAIGRLEAEVKALKALHGQPGILRLLYANVAQRFIVTEFHARGALNKHLHLYRGNVLAALEAFKPLVDAASKIHQEGAIHRDIKTENIFVSTSNNLILGDFGIVFFNENSERLTTTYERVGSHFWMAPWAYDNARLELGKISPALDIFPLAKVLWSMIAGRNGFSFWEYQREENNLEILFPNDPLMALVNEHILSTRIVREEKECNGSAEFLGLQVERLINYIKDRQGYKPDNADAWPCKVCGRGKYKSDGPKYQIKGFREGGPVLLQNQSFFASVCDYCGHVELFAHRDK